MTEIVEFVTLFTGDGGAYFTRVQFRPIMSECPGLRMRIEPILSVLQQRSRYQIVATGAYDFPANEFTDDAWFSEDYAGIDVGRVIFGAGDEGLID